MSVIFITGLSGVGKSSVLNHLEKKNYKTVDLDNGYMTLGETGERLLDEEKIMDLIANHQETDLFLAGTESNQGTFYPHFDQVVLLTADLETMLARIEQRTTNDYGKSPVERAQIIKSFHEVLPLLKERPDLIIDSTSKTIEEISEQLIDLL